MLSSRANHVTPGERAACWWEAAENRSWSWGFTEVFLLTSGELRGGLWEAAEQTAGLRGCHLLGVKSAHALLFQSPGPGITGWKASCGHSAGVATGWCWRGHKLTSTNLVLFSVETMERQGKGKMFTFFKFPNIPPP